MTILVINGPNLNLLGQRNQKYYGKKTLKAINQMLLNCAEKSKVKLLFFQSNCEGKIIDFIQKSSKRAEGILINPGALTHYGYSLRDALLDTELPIIEVHLSSIEERENFRKIDVLSDIVIEKIFGFGEKSYLLGLEKLVDYLGKRDES